MLYGTAFSILALMCTGYTVSARAIDIDTSIMKREDDTTPPANPPNGQTAGDGSSGTGTDTSAGTGNAPSQHRIKITAPKFSTLTSVPLQKDDKPYGGVGGGDDWTVDWDFTMFKVQFYDDKKGKWTTEGWNIDDKKISTPPKGSEFKALKGKVVCSAANFEGGDKPFEVKLKAQEPYYEIVASPETSSIDGTTISTESTSSSSPSSTTTSKPADTSSSATPSPNKRDDLTSQDNNPGTTNDKRDEATPTSTKTTAAAPTRMVRRDGTIVEDGGNGANDGQAVPSAAVKKSAIVCTKIE